MNTGCPRTLVHETALQLLQVLDKRFFGSVGPLASDGETGEFELRIKCARVHEAEIREQMLQKYENI